MRVAIINTVTARFPLPEQKFANFGNRVGQRTPVYQFHDLITRPTTELVWSGCPFAAGDQLRACAPPAGPIRKQRDNIVTGQQVSARAQIST